MKKDIAHPGFATRLEQACDGNPDVPEPNFGRLRWFVEELEKHDVTTSREGVRKWFAGITYPRPPVMSALSKILKVDPGWLSVGDELLARSVGQFRTGDGSLGEAFRRLCSQ